MYVYLHVCMYASVTHRVSCPRGGLSTHRVSMDVIILSRPEERHVITAKLVKILNILIFTHDALAPTHVLLSVTDSTQFVLKTSKTTIVIIINSPELIGGHGILGLGGKELSN